MYEFVKEDLDGFRQFVGGDTREHGKELEWKHCPYCEGGEHGDKWTFSISTETGQFICQRASCGKQGAFVQLARDFGYNLPDAETEYKDYTGSAIGKLETWVATDEAKEYLRTRRIPDEIVEKYKITTYANQPKTMVFPFFDDRDELQCIKYRNAAYTKPKSGEAKRQMKEWWESNTKPILYGMWLCEKSGTLVVTEGQIDALSLAAAGIKNPVSVPGGAQNFRWVKYCRDFVERYNEIVIFGDCENGKITLVDGFCKHFPKIKIRAVRIVDYLKCKDANEILQGFPGNHGYAILRECVENAVDVRRLPVKKMSEIDWHYSDTEQKIKTGFLQLDRTIKGLAYGQLCILTGWSGDGKSNFASQMAVNIAHQGVGVLIYSGEMSNELVTEQISFIIAGASRITQTISEDDDTRTLTDEDETRKGITAWMIHNKIYLWEDQPIMDDNQKDETVSFLNQLEMAIDMLECRFIILDNLMTLLTVSEDSDVYQAQTNLIKRLKTVARAKNVVILLVAHPRKSPTSSRELTQDSISGSKDIVNLADMVFAYTRHRDPEKAQYPRRLNVLKNRRRGILLEGDEGVYLMYDQKSGRIAESKNDFGFDYLEGYAKSVIPEIDF